MEQSLDKTHPLYALNNRIVELESARDDGALSPLLHDALVFRRANGDIVFKGEYLQGLADIVSVRWARSVVLDIQQHGEDLAVVTCLVAIDREQKGKEDARITVQGTFLNLRVWTRTMGEWKLIGWYNQRA